MTGEGGGDGLDCDVEATSCLGASASTGISRFEISSPSSASRAIVLPTGTPRVPSGAYEDN